MALSVPIDTRDISVTPVFQHISVEDVPASEREKRLVMKHIEAVEVRFAGSKNYSPVFPVDAMWKREGLNVITYYALSAGFLTGKYRSKADLDQSPRGKSVERFMDDKGMRVLAALDTVAERTGAAHSEIAIAWLNAQPGVAAPIASATSLEQMQSLVRGARLQLGQDDLTLLTEAGA